MNEKEFGKPEVRKVDVPERANEPEINPELDACGCGCGECGGVPVDPLADIAGELEGIDPENAPEGFTEALMAMMFAQEVEEATKLTAIVRRGLIEQMDARIVFTAFIDQFAKAMVDACQLDVDFVADLFDKLPAFFAENGVEVEAKFISAEVPDEEEEQPEEAEEQKEDENVQKE